MYHDDDHLAKLVLIGSSTVGKTSLVTRSATHTFDPNYQVTLGASYIVQTAELGDRHVELQIWDTAGMERYATLGPVYYRDADAVMFVYDLTNPSSAEALPHWFEAFTQAIQNPYFGLVVGNKLDLCPEPDTAATEAWATEKKLGFMTASAKSGRNVHQIFDILLQAAFLTKNARVFEAPLRRKEHNTCC
jgi:small GTP-binding protein